MFNLYDTSKNECTYSRKRSYYIMIDKPIFGSILSYKHMTQITISNIKPLSISVFRDISFTLL